MTGERELARHDFGPDRIDDPLTAVTCCEANWRWVEALFHFSLLLRMTFSENRFPSLIASGTGFFGIVH